jgi:hypothetical protein
MQPADSTPLAKPSSALKAQGNEACNVVRRRNPKVAKATRQRGAHARGDHDILLQKIFEEFCPRFTPGDPVVYIGDAGEKRAYFDDAMLTSLGIVPESLWNMPSLIVFHESRGWLFLIEAATGRGGPMSTKRLVELEALFCNWKTGLVFVTAFPDREALRECLSEIAWESEVWLADAPTHLIHFDGGSLLGPYDESPSTN